MAKIAVVGVGPGGKEHLTPAAIRAVAEADVLVGGERGLALFSGQPGEIFTIKNNLQEMIAYIRERMDEKKIAVIASGDPGMYGILQYLRRHFTPAQLQVIPGISSVQYACARLAVSWHDAVVVSTHGRDRTVLAETVAGNSKVVVLAGPEEPPPVLASVLVNAGMKDKTVYVCAELSYPAEEINAFTVLDLARWEGQWNKRNYVMVILDEQPMDLPDTGNKR